MANFVYNKGLTELSTGGGTTWTSSDIRVVLVKSGYVANRDHDFLDDIGTANELTGTRTALANLTKTQNDTDDNVILDADDLSITFTGTAIGLVVYRHTGSDATAPLLAFLDDAFPQTSDGGGASPLVWPANGVIKIRS
jgi:hypothetical protein